MKDSEKIEGNKIHIIFEKLKLNHTILNIHIMGTDFDGVTVILGVSDGEKPRFFIDDPGRIDSAAPFVTGSKCYFEFSDENKIKYSFKTSVDRIFGRRIKFYFPEFIERAQRRKTFRIPVPSETSLQFSMDDNYFKFDVINISEGGLLADIDKKLDMKNSIFTGMKPANLLLLSENTDMPLKIHFKSAEIVRIENLNESGRVNYGINIIDIDKSSQEELKKFIYFCQRRVLRKRGGFES